MSYDPELTELGAVVKRLRRRDYPAYLSVRLSPVDSRDMLYWLYGFYMELGQIPRRVDEPLLGEIRLQWWRDSIAKLVRGERIGHPVADGLGPALVEQGELLQQALTGIIDSFTFEVQKTAVPSMEAFYQVQDQRHGGMLRAALLIAGRSEPASVLAATEAGMSIGVTETIARLPLALQAGIQPLPGDMLAAHGLGYEAFMSEAAPDAETASRIEKALYAIADGAVIISWDIKARINGLARRDRVYFSRWVIVPALLKRAIDDRRRGMAVVSGLNPLRVYMTQVRGVV